MYADLYCDQQGGLCCTDALSILHFAKLPDTSVDKNQPLAPAGRLFFSFLFLSLLFIYLLIYLFEMSFLPLLLAADVRAGGPRALPDSEHCANFKKFKRRFRRFNFVPLIKNFDFRPQQNQTNTIGKVGTISLFI